MKVLDEVRWGIIGCGDVCEIKSGPALYKTPHSTVQAVMRRNAAKAEDFASRHGIERWYDDATRLIHDKDVNAIYIATPPGSHAEYALLAAKAGKPVYVEKPMARTHKECLAMTQAFREAGLPLYVAFYRRALPNFLWVKELLDKGVIGEVRFVSIDLCQPLQADLIAVTDENWRVDPEQAGGGYFYDLASHQFDFLDFALGPVRRVSGYKKNQAGAYPAADIVCGNFEFESGVMGRGMWCFNVSANSRRDEIKIVGEKGYIRFPTFGSGKVQWAAEGQEEQLKEFELPKHIHQFLVEQVVDNLRGKRKEVASTGDSGSRTNWVLEQMKWI